MNLTRAFRATGRRLSLPVVLILSMFMIQPAFAAGNVAGSINGEVVSEGGAVGGANVTVTNLGTGLTRSAVTNADGSFVFPGLPVGSYSVVVDAQGYPQATRDSVSVNVGTGTSLTVFVGDEAAQLAAVTVSGTAISAIDITSTESATVIGEQTIDRIPVNRTVTDVALLAPGTTRGDSAFGNLASFGGATVGENVCYINGLNVTNFRNGLGCSSVPFEFYKEFQLKTGGYSAEFGRATGGVINAVTKSGTNEFEYGFNLFWEPWIDDINSPGHNVYYPYRTESVMSYGPDGLPGTADDAPVDAAYPGGDIFRDRESDEFTSLEANVYASGPIIEDRAFFYVLYNLRDVEADDYVRNAGTFFKDTTDDAFWGMKLDFNITSDHLVEVTAFSDERTIESAEYPLTPNGAVSDYDNWSIGSFAGSSFSDRGGMNYIARYTGFLTPDFTLSAMYGENEYDLTDRSAFDATCPYIIDIRSASTNQTPGCWVNALPGVSKDNREATRIDGDWYIGDHHLRFGYDNETNTSETNTSYSGGYYWLYGNFSAAAGGGESARLRYYSQGGSFETSTSALYIEDSWSVTDTIMLRIGLRNETFENKNGNGDPYIEIDNQLAPRIGVSWDALGDGSLRVFANYGRYYLPVANNTSVRLAGNEEFTEAFFRYTGNVDPTTGAPITFIDDDGDVITFNPANVLSNLAGDDISTSNYAGATPVSYNIYADGDVPDTGSIVDQDIDPMYQDEFIFGFDKDVGNGWSVGVSAVFRELKSTLEDITTDEAFSALGYDAQGCGIGAFHYVLANPGQDVTITWDCPTGTPETFVLSAEDLGYPESIRKYNAVQFEFERAWDGLWFLQGSYTWSQSYGNNEGFVRSDNGQDDAGLTTLYDFAGLLDGAYGPLPNDRTHALKVYGAYQFADHWRLGANFLMESGRPINAFGVHGTDQFAALYGAESFYQDGVLVQRGSRGRTPFKSQIDLSLDYNTTFGAVDANFGLDVFNVFDSNIATEVSEVAEGEAAGATGPGAVNRSYLLESSSQRPRYIRLRAQFDF